MEEENLLHLFDADPKSILMKKEFLSCLDENRNGVKFVADWEKISDLTAQHTNLIQYQGVYVATRNGHHIVLDENPKKYLASTVANLNINISPSLANEIATATLQRVRQVDPVLKDTYIYFNNGMFDTVSGKFLQENTSTTEYNHRRLRHNYKKPTDDSVKVFNSFIGQYANGDAKLATQLIEIIGAVMMPTRILRKALFMLGSGGQGKSGFMDFTRDVIGQSHISDIPLTNLASSRAFEKLPLVNKMGNFIDDLSSISMKENGAFKSLVAGGTVSAEVKGGKIFSFANEATIFANGNSLPTMNDKGSSTAITDRMHIIELTTKIKKDFEKFNRVRQEDIYQAASYLAAQAMHAACERGWELTQTEATKNSLREFELDQDSVLRWLDNVPEFFNKAQPTANAYMQYKIATETTGAYALGERQFVKAMQKHRPDLERKQVRVNNGREYCWITKGGKDE